MPLCAKCPECKPRCSPGHACQEWVCAITGAQVLPGNGVHADPTDAALAELIANQRDEVHPAPPVRPCDDTGKEVCPLNLYPGGQLGQGAVIKHAREYVVREARRRGAWDRLLGYYPPKQREMLSGM